MEHVDKRTLTTGIAKYAVNPVVKRLAGKVPYWAVLETKGRRTGEPRRTPVGNGLDGDTFWIVSEHGRGSNYVKNIVADPNVRLRIKGQWRRGIAHLMPDDDARERQRSLGRLNSAMVRTVGTDLLTVRIDLEPEDG